jgi:hypothetical protein
MNRWIATILTFFFFFLVGAVLADNGYDNEHNNMITRQTKLTFY